jgi:GMP synthase (glutamine-hydrolysing)
MRVLSVTHGPTVPGGVFDETVVEAGHALERWSGPGGAAPRAAHDYGAVLVFGGAMHPDADESFPWLAREADFLREAIAARVPTFGVCLGAQLIARAAGGAVKPASEPEIGWYGVSLTPAGVADPVLGALPPTASVFQWHHYTFDLPPGGVELARSSVCSQAFRLEEPAWAIQFHAEVTSPMIDSWVEEDPDDLPMPADELRAESTSRIAASTEQGRALAGAFLREAAVGPG